LSRPYLISSSILSKHLVTVVPLTTVSNLGVTNSDSFVINAILATAASNNTYYLVILIP
jgi:hypothetical protein